jgi:hypothetical protein
VDVYPRRLFGLKDMLVCHFKLAADIVGGGIKEFGYDRVRSTFLKAELMGSGV